MQQMQSERAHCAAWLMLCTIAGLSAGCALERPAGADAEAAYGALAAAGADAAAISGPGAACGSRGLPHCAAGQFCHFPPSASCGDADEPGVCRARPTFCPQIWQPVCGCDGRTYANACRAAASGVSVRTQGACAPEPRACGGLLGLRCETGEYCDFPPEAHCGRADAMGTCAAQPAVCTREFRPVCGCDGITYGNACMAAGAGVSVEHLGACASSGEVCGGLLGIGCADDQFCDFAAGDGCDVADGQGVCTDVPDACTEQFDPVCGCDGVTYGNACLAAASGASIRARGACAKH
jgi:hypothetical protein